MWEGILQAQDGIFAQDDIKAFFHPNMHRATLIMNVVFSSYVLKEDMRYLCLFFFFLGISCMISYEHTSMFDFSRGYLFY